MADIVISDEHEVKTLESIERIEFSTNRFRELIEKYDTYQASELEPLLQQILTIEDANKNIKTIICGSLNTAK